MCSFKMNFANKVSIFRILSIPFFVASLIYYLPQRDFLRFVALLIFSLAVISDAIDGLVARLGKQKTKIGAIIDPLADKMLLVSAFICLYFVNNLPQGIRIPLWFVLVVISRDAIILLGAMLILIMKQDLEIVPSSLGKLTTLFQMLTIISVILQFNFSYIIWWLAAVLTLISGFGYMRKGFRILYAYDNKNNLKSGR